MGEHLQKTSDSLFLADKLILSYQYIGWDDNYPPPTTEKVADVGFPVKGSDDVTFAVMTDLSARSIAGTKKYGECLCAGRKCANDKSNLQNLYEELLDAACYLKKEMMEEK